MRQITDGIWTSASDRGISRTALTSVCLGSSIHRKGAVLEGPASFRLGGAGMRLPGLRPGGDASLVNVTRNCGGPFCVPHPSEAGLPDLKLAPANAHRWPTKGRLASTPWARTGVRLPRGRQPGGHIWPAPGLRSHELGHSRSFL